MSEERPEPGRVITRVLQNYDAAVQKREPWVRLWRECYDVTLPEQARFCGDMTAPTRKNDLIFDGTAPDAVDQLAASLVAQLTPPWGNWVQFAPGSDVLQDDRNLLIKLLEKTTLQIQDEIDRSNLLTALHQCFLDLVIGGTAVLYVTQTAPGALCAFDARAIALSDVTLGGDLAGNLRAVYLRRVISRDTLNDMMRQGGLDTRDLALGSPDDTFDIIEFCEPHGAQFLTGVVALDVMGAPQLVRCMIQDASPFIVFRWTRKPGELFGRSPVMKALPDIKTANKVVELILKNASLAVTGMWQAEDDGVLNLSNIQLTPGAIIPKAPGSAGLKPIEMPARFDVSQLVLDDLRARIRHALLVDRFAQIEQQRMTATEVMERADAAAALLGAIYGGLQVELLNPLIARIYHILRTQGAIADLPLDGRVVQVVHTSPLARAQAGQTVRPVLAWLDAVRQLGGGAVAQIDALATARYLADALGVPAALLTPSTPSIPQETTQTTI